MVVLSRLNLITRKLQICSKGDASCNVYLKPSNGKTELYHKQPHHSPGEVLKHYNSSISLPTLLEKKKEMLQKNISCKNIINYQNGGRYRAAPPIPDTNGTTFHWNPDRLAYSFYFSNGDCVASSSFVGHRNVS
jgi:hypothetical protein